MLIIQLSTSVNLMLTHIIYPIKSLYCKQNQAKTKTLNYIGIQYFSEFIENDCFNTIKILLKTQLFFK